MRLFQSKKGIIAFVGGLVAVVLIVIYIAFTVFFQSHFFFHTRINGVDCSGQTVAAVKERISEEMAIYKLTIEEKGGIQTLHGSDLGVEAEFDGTLEDVLKDQKGYAWIPSLFRQKNIEEDTLVKYDETKLDEVVGGLDFLQDETAQKPENAHVSDYIPGKGYEIVPEVEGNYIDPEKFKAALLTAIENLQTEFSVEKADCYEVPTVRSDDPQLTNLVAEMNKYLGITITYEAGGETEVVNGDKIHEWLKVGDNQTAELDEGKVAAFVGELGAKYNTSGKPKTLKTSWGPTVTVPGGNYGWLIDKDVEVAQLIADVKAGTDVTREPKWKQKAAGGFGATDYGNTYVEVNLTAQHLYFYKNGSLVIESDFVSGNVKLNRITHVGAYAIAYTQRNATLKGQDYATPVSYWMPFHNGEGLHDAWWRGDFGGAIYKTDGSHGCVNCPTATAKTIFENIKAGDAVLVYELPGTESPKAKDQSAGAEVTSAINAIGEVTTGSGSAISNARNKYNALSSGAKAYVKNYDTLTAAEEAFKHVNEPQPAQPEPAPTEPPQDTPVE
ncbi:hypothetical protein FACS1894111_03310 [Clostridia bacterium]|nr:hypothetical protein FACS1894111_03310 [Clostridia bacterium]